MKPFAQMDEQEFLEIFEACQFPLVQWRHRPHVTLAYIYLRQYPFDQALAKTCNSIKKHNAANNLPNAYHETLTQVWVKLIHATIAAHGPADNAKTFFNRHTYLLNKMLPLLFYTYPRLISKQAREEFLAPDVLPLPTPPAASVFEVTYQPDTNAFLPISPDPLFIISTTTQTLTIDPTNTDAYYKRAQAYYDRQDFTNALADYMVVISHDPDHVGAHYGLAATYASQDNPESAVTHLKKALDLGFPPLFLERDPVWQKIDTTPSFQVLLESL